MAPAIFAPLGLLSPFSSLLHKHLLQTFCHQAHPVRLPLPRRATLPHPHNFPAFAFCPLLTSAIKPSCYQTPPGVCPRLWGFSLPQKTPHIFLLSQNIYPPNTLGVFAPACGAFPLNRTAPASPLCKAAAHQHPATIYAPHSPPATPPFHPRHTTAYSHHATTCP